MRQVKYMQVLIELGYILIIMIGAMGFAMQALSGFKNLDVTNPMAESKNTTLFMALIVIFNVCDFLIVFLQDVLGDFGISWIYVIENVLEVAMAYALIAFERDFVKEEKVPWLPVFFMTVASVILWTDTLYTVEMVHMSEMVYVIIMIVLNLLPILVMGCYCFKYMRIIMKLSYGKSLKLYMVVHNILFVALCTVTTINTFDSRTAWDFVMYDEEVYIITWILFNIMNAIFIWTSCQIVSEPDDPLEETIEEMVEKLSEKYGLSGREEEIAMLIYKGLNNNEIADTLCLSTNTVKVHASNLYRKIGASNRLQAVQLIRGINER